MYCNSTNNESLTPYYECDDLAEHIGKLRLLTSNTNSIIERGVRRSKNGELFWVELVSLEEIISSLKDAFKETDDDDEYEYKGYKTFCILDALELNGEELIRDIERAVATHEAREAARPAAARDRAHQLLLQQFENLSRVLHQEILPLFSPSLEALDLSFSNPLQADKCASISSTAQSLDLASPEGKSWRAPINMTSLHRVSTACSILVSQDSQSANLNRTDKSVDVCN